MKGSLWLLGLLGLTWVALGSTAASCTAEAEHPKRSTRARPESAPQGKPPPTVVPAAEEASTLDGLVVSTTAGLALRKRPATDARLVARLLHNEEMMVASPGDVATVGGKTARWYELVTADGKRGWAFGAYLAKSPGGPATAAATERAKRERLRSVFSPLDSTTLPKLLAARGYRPPKTFKALVVAIRGDPDKGFTYHPYDFSGTSRHRDNWWPASNVKIYSAVAALVRLRSWGFHPSAKATFHYADGDVTTQVRRLVKRAITPSNNLAFDRLTEIAGSDYLHTRFFTKGNGLADTTLLRSYTHRLINEETEEGQSRDSPAITLRMGKRTKRLEARYNGRSLRERRCFGIDKDNRPRPGPPFEGNCTTLRDLSEIMRRVMMHEYLPPSERFDLGTFELEVLREAMADRRSRGMNVVDGIQAGFGRRKLDSWSKAGYALSWFSDNVFIQVRGSDERYIVVMANYPGRGACDEAARHVGAILGAGHLRTGGGAP